MKLTEATRRGLVAVREGKAYRIYRGDGNTLHCEGVASSTLWRLERLKLIRDGRSTAGGFSIRCPMELTPAGEKAAPPAPPAGPLRFYRGVTPL